MPAIDTIQDRRGTASEWASANPILAPGERGFETDSRLTKHGDGTTLWNALPYDPFGPIASDAEALAGTDDTKAMTPAKVRGVLPWIDIRQYGAVADFDIATQTMTTDSTAAIQAAVDAAPWGGMVLVPACPDGKAFACGQIDINKPLTFSGVNRYGSRLVAKPGMTAGTHLLNLTIGTLNVHPREESHGFGYQISDLYLDGARRVPDVAGVKLQQADRFVLERMQIRNFARQAIHGNQTPRESEVRSVYIRYCGNIGYPAVDFSDVHTGDAANNITFEGVKVLYSFGEALHIEPTEASSTRIFTFTGCMFHNVAAFQVDTETEHTVDSDGWAPAVNYRELESPVITLASARDIAIIGGRIHAGGRGQPLIQIRAGGFDAPKTLSMFGVSLGDIDTTVLTDVSTATNVFTSTSHRLGTGALVRVTGSSLVETTDYWVIRLSADTFSLAASLTDARAGTPVVAVTDATGITITPQARHIDQEGTNVYTDVVACHYTNGGTYRATVINRTGSATRATVTGGSRSATVAVETI